MEQHFKIKSIQFPAMMQHPNSTERQSEMDTDSSGGIRVSPTQ